MERFLYVLGLKLGRDFIPGRYFTDLKLAKKYKNCLDGKKLYKIKKTPLDINVDTILKCFSFECILINPTSTKTIYKNCSVLDVYKKVTIYEDIHSDNITLKIYIPAYTKKYAIRCLKVILKHRHNSKYTSTPKLKRIGNKFLTKNPEKPTCKK